MTNSLRQAVNRSARTHRAGEPAVGEQLAIAASLPSAEEIGDRVRGLGIEMDPDDALAIGHEARRAALEAVERQLTPPNPIARFIRDVWADPEIRDVWPPSRMGLRYMLEQAHRAVGQEPPDEATCDRIVGVVYDAIVEAGERREHRREEGDDDERR